jgi:PAS domain S-box-containing protein
LAAAFLSNKDLAPLISLAYLVAIAAAGWMFGLGAGLFVSAVTIVALTAIVTHGKLFIPPHLDYAAILGLIFIAILSSRVAAYRNKVEQVLRSANDELERRVRERTVDLERAREWFQITLASIGDAVIATDTESRVTLLNGVAQAITGWTQDEAYGRQLTEVFRIVNEETRATVESPVTKVLRMGNVVGLANHTMLLARDGREIPIDDSAAPIRTGGGELAGVVLIFRDIAERRKVEQEREQLLTETAAARAEAEYQRSHLQSLFLQAPVAIDVIRGPSHVYEFAHPLTRERLGRDVTGMTVRDALDDAEDRGVLKILDEVYNSGVAYNGKGISVQCPAAGGMEDHYFDLTITPWRDADGSVAGVIAMAADVTEQVHNRRAMEAAEERLRETAKLESLGVLAGGIAHDFNNLLVGILGNASLAEEMLPPGSPIRDLMGDVVNASDKAALLTRQMLAYSGRGKFVVERVDLSTMVREILPLVSRSISPAVSVDLALAPDLPPVECDKTQMHQVIMNLLINAAESCNGQPGMVRVTTSAGAADARTLRPAFGLPPVQQGNYVRLEVRDTGSGMTEEVKAKIFDPFFTTKFTGRGLGLSAALGIIRSHHGAIEVESAPGKGTTFRISFPAAAGGSANAADAKAVEQHHTGSGTILVIDDEEVVRKTARVALQNHGYRVLTAENGESGLHIFRGMPGEIELVILDLTMPVMGGETTLENLKAISPEAKVVLSSGFSSAEVTARFQGRGLAGFLQKPYSAAKLVEEVRTALNHNGRAQTL